ncbi:MAG TPA: creatininase family protein [Vicinamibacterales bacterium]|jgi:creatinine amidohydrolase/Fe(II)-dependent formamide hydrolase-like protein
MKKTIVFVASMLCSTLAMAQSPAVNVKNTVDMEQLTHTEVSHKIHNEGMTSVLIAAGGTEERGPQDVLGGHTFIARYNATLVAKKLGNALVAPVLPITPNATGARPGTNTPGAVTLPADVFKAVVSAEIESMAWSGFKDIYVMGDHGGGQKEMQQAAEEADAKLGSTGVHVYYIADFYDKTHNDIDMYLYEHKLPIGGHGAMMETSEMLYMEPSPGAWVRPIYKTVPFDPTGITPEQWKAQRDAHDAGRPAPARAPRQASETPRVDNGLSGDPHPSTPQIGKDLIDICVNNTVAEIRKVTAERRAAK